MHRGRKGIAEPITIALIALASTFLTVVFEKETNYTITNMIYDDNSTKCLKSSEIKVK